MGHLGSCIPFPFCYSPPVMFPSCLCQNAYEYTMGPNVCFCTWSLWSKPPTFTRRWTHFLILFPSGGNLECIWSRLFEGLTLLIFFSRYQRENDLCLPHPMSKPWVAWEQFRHGPHLSCFIWKEWSQHITGPMAWKWSNYWNPTIGMCTRGTHFVRIRSG